jgi:hypothetical protein
MGSEKLADALLNESGPAKPGFKSLPIGRGLIASRITVGTSAIFKPGAKVLPTSDPKYFEAGSCALKVLVTCDDG